MKENKIEKLILDLSTRWNCSPQEAVDRLNSMNESEINKLINSMTKKFQVGGRMEWLPDLQYRETKLWTPDPKNPNIEWHTRTNRAVGKVYDSYPTVKGAQLGGDEYYSGGEQFINERPIAYISRWKDFHDRLQKEGLQPKMSGISKKENGGFIDCLRGGDSVEKCKCGCDKIAKAEDGNALYPYHKGKFVQSVDSNPLYPAGDGEGQISGEVRPFGDTVIVYRTPSHIYTQTRTTDGDVFIDHSAPHGSRRYYSPESKSRGFMRNVAPSWMVDLMNGVKEKFSTDVQTKKCGGSLPKKKKNYLKKK